MGMVAGQPYFLYRQYTINSWIMPESARLGCMSVKVAQASERTARQALLTHRHQRPCGRTAHSQVVPAERARVLALQRLEDANRAERVVAHARDKRLFADILTDRAEDALRRREDILDLARVCRARGQRLGAASAHRRRRRRGRHGHSVATRHGRCAGRAGGGAAINTRVRLGETPNQNGQVDRYSLTA